MKELKDYPGYFITECGEVYNQLGEKRPEYITGIPAYRYVNLPDAKAANNGYWQVKRVHILVAHTYIPNPEDLPIVNHIDEDKMNCHVSNLEWCTQSHNQKHSVASRVKTYKPRKKYTEEEKRQAVEDYRRFDLSKRRVYMHLEISALQFENWLKLY